MSEPRYSVANHYGQTLCCVYDSDRRLHYAEVVDRLNEAERLREENEELKSAIANTGLEATVCATCKKVPLVWSADIEPFCVECGPIALSPPHGE